MAPMAVRATVAERTERGRAARRLVPRSAHAEWAPAAGRPDPARLIAAEDATRLQFLVPVRHERMSVSPFTFYRATAALMASDLGPAARTPIVTQLCGDAHIGNFGAFASPERDLLFDCNDFDETLPGPFEWDVKRLAASVVLAGRHAGMKRKETRAMTLTAIGAYQRSIRRLADLGNLDVWYDRVSIEAVGALIQEEERRRQFDSEAAKARRRNSLRSFRKLAEIVDGKARLRSDPPLLLPLRDVEELDQITLQRGLAAVYERYRASIGDELCTLLDRYEIADAAVKVVGVGSVGTRCFVVLLVGRDEGDPLLLQVKEAGASALEATLGASAYDNAGRRVVEGQRLMQAFGDIFLGWAEGVEAGRAYYWRQLKDMKWSIDFDTIDMTRLERFATACGWTLARAHARAGDAIEIAAYIGKGETFPEAITRFGETYADQAQADYEEFVAASAAGASGGQA